MKRAAFLATETNGKFDREENEGYGGAGTCTANNTLLRSCLLVAAGRKNQMGVPEGGR